MSFIVFRANEILGNIFIKNVLAWVNMARMYYSTHPGGRE
ncbi:Hypothetical protein ETEE_0096 [Edwardsiella anguillarum ET080813]|uniref:Uncharacterized protein n=1 Tax=Edwardsiella anguillarum ET080813 TaxID=667120 RepID=A0A076LI44_9GAMM|nr:Hypothetical protein ETEE_0096 [Edwardsiella anguillarum ET080813]